MRFTVCVCSFFLSCLILGGTASADIVTITFQGFLNEILALDSNGNDDTANFEAVLPFTTGDQVTASVTYDTSVLDSDSRSGFGRYVQQGPRVIEINGTVFVSDLLLDVVDNQLNQDQLLANSLVAPPFNASGWVWTNGGSSVGSDQISLQDFSQEVFDSDAPPVGPLTESDFDLLTWSIDFTSQTGSNTLETPLGTHIGTRHRIAGTFTEALAAVSIEAVPEPGSVSFLVFCAALLGIRRARVGSA